MTDEKEHPKPLSLFIGLLLAGLVLIAVGVFTRDTIGHLASWLVISAGIVIAILPPALWRRGRNRQLK